MTGERNDLCDRKRVVVFCPTERTKCHDDELMSETCLIFQFSIIFAN